MDDPDIIKKLREEEKLGKLHSNVQNNYEELELPEEDVEKASDETVVFIENDVERKTREDEFNSEKTKNTLRGIEEKYRLIIENTSDLIALTTFRLNPTYTYVSPSLKKVLGYEPRDLIGKPCFDFLHPDDKKWLLPLLKKYVVMKAKNLLTGKDLEVSETIEYRFRDKSGNWHYLESTANLIGDELLFISRDVTEHRLIEAELQESKEMYMTLVKTSPDAVTVTDLDGTITYVSQQTLKLHGFKSAEELVGRSSLELIAPEDHEKAIINLKKTLEEGLVRDLEYAFVKKDGTRFTVELSASLIKDADGKPKAFIANTRDITERKMAEEKLKESEKRFRDISHSMADWIWEVDKDGRYTSVSGKVKQILGYDSEELIGKTPFDLMPRDEAKRVGEVFKRITSEKKTIVDLENWNLTRQGEKVCLLTNGVPILDENGELEGYRGVDKDITERRNAEDKLKEKIDELERYKKVTVDRELRLIELKKELKELKTKLQDGK